MEILRFCKENFGCMVVYEAKGQKSKRVITGGAYEYVDMLKMNILEKQEIEKALLAKGVGSKG